MILLYDVSAKATGKCLANLGLVKNNYIKEVLDSKIIADSPAGVYSLSTM